MGLYRIILVDDEEEVRKGIIKKINWEALGFEVVGDAENGQDALEKIEQLEPEVIMTDIRMPYMDGLELTAKIRQKYPSMKVLIFSGYDDFEYAQQAIKLNVTEYILKPVNVEELTGILTRVRENLDQEIEQRRNLDLLRESYLKSLPILKELFLNELISGSSKDGEDTKKCLEEYGIDLLGARKWVTAVVGIELEAGPLAHHKELIPISVRRLIEDNLKPYCRAAVFATSEGLALIAAIDDDKTQTALIDQLGDICKECRRILEVTITIGIGHSSQSLDALGASYQSAVDALGYKAIVGAGSTIYINDMEPVSRGKLQLDAKEEAELVAAIKFGGKEKIREIAHQITVRMEDAKVHVRQQQIYMMAVINALMRLIQQYDLNISEVLQMPERYQEIPDAMQNREEFEEWLIRTACRISEMMGLERDNTAKRMILDAKQYIQENYQNPDLSVEMVCRQLHLSPAYFSTMFKKETGQTYVGYLTELRLDKAVELLNTTDDKTYIIAQKVGYQEQNYFSYVFKKRFGVSPTRFRQAQ